MSGLAIGICLGIPMGAAGMLVVVSWCAMAGDSDERAERAASREGRDGVPHSPHKAADAGSIPAPATGSPRSPSTQDAAPGLVILTPRNHHGAFARRRWFENN